MRKTIEMSHFVTVSSDVFPFEAAAVSTPAPHFWPSLRYGMKFKELTVKTSSSPSSPSFWSAVDEVVEPGWRGKGEERHL